jgi:hypothetical protein
MRMSELGEAAKLMVYLHYAQFIVGLLILPFLAYFLAKFMKKVMEKL